MLLMALNVCWTAAMTKRSPGQGGRLSSGVLGSRLAFWAWQKWDLGAGVGVQVAGRDAQWQWWEKFSSIPQRALSHPQASLSLVCRESSREASWGWSPDLMEYGGGWQRAVESGAGRVPVVSVCLSCLHLQQSQHCWVVSEFHPPLGGQAHVLSQVVYRSCTETKRHKW